jgi:hypothetical protein
MMSGGKLNHAAERKISWAVCPKKDLSWKKEEKILVGK